MHKKWDNVNFWWDGGKGGSSSDDSIIDGLGWGFGTKLLSRRNINRDILQFLT